MAANLNHVPPHVPPLGADVRNEIGLQLQETLLDLIGLALVGKQLRWSVVGRMLRSQMPLVQDA